MKTYRIRTLKDGLGDFHFRVDHLFKLFWFIPIWIEEEDPGSWGSSNVFEADDYDKAQSRINELKRLELKYQRKRVDE